MEVGAVRLLIGQSFPVEMWVLLAGGVAGGVSYGAGQGVAQRVVPAGVWEEP